MSGNFRIVQREYANGNVVYVLEKQTNFDTWESRFSHHDLDVIKLAKLECESERVISEKIIE